MQNKEELSKKTNKKTMSFMQNMHFLLIEVKCDIQTCINYQNESDYEPQGFTVKKVMSLN